MKIDTVRPAQKSAADQLKGLTKSDISKAITSAVNAEKASKDLVSKAVLIALSQLVENGSNANANKLLEDLNSGNRIKLQELITECTIYKIDSIHRKKINETKADIKRAEDEFADETDILLLKSQLKVFESSTIKRVYGKKTKGGKESEASVIKIDPEKVIKSGDDQKEADFDLMVDQADANFMRFLNEHGGDFWKWCNNADKEYKEQKRQEAKDHRKEKQDKARENWTPVTYYVNNSNNLIKAINRLLKQDDHPLPKSVAEKLIDVLKDGENDLKKQLKDQALMEAFGADTLEELHEMQAAAEERKQAARAAKAAKGDGDTTETADETNAADQAGEM